jgi:protein-S-isoprenylcysteine O-methyltransferase Ste14
VRRFYIWFDLAICLAVYVYCLREHRPGEQYLVGMLIGAAGFLLWLIARIQIGESFSARPRAHALVTTGLYAKIRNPIYVFSTIGVIGMCLAMHWYVFGVVYGGFLSLVQWRRARAEAAVLEKAFGDQYRKYRAQTWF